MNSTAKQLKSILASLVEETSVSEVLAALAAVCHDKAVLDEVWTVEEILAREG